jgi:hypothetical protein
MSQVFEAGERHGVFRVLGGEVLLGDAVVTPLDGAAVLLAHRAVTPPSTTMHAPITEADSSEAR